MLRRKIHGEIHFRVFRFLKSFPVRPGNLRQYTPRPLRPEVFPELHAANLPSIAIVTPSFNQAGFLPQTVGSIVSQNYMPFSYCVMDGGSQDGSPEVLECLAAADAFQWCSAPDRGQADAINRGFARVQGDVMAWVNSDDLLLPGSLDFVGRYFATHPEVDVLYGHRVLIDETGSEIGRWVVPPYFAPGLSYFDYVPQETMFWRRRVWEEVGGLDESFQFALDWDLLLRFREVGARMVRVPYFLGAFRIHPSQKTNSQIHEVGRREMRRLRNHYGADAAVDRRMINLHNRELMRAFLTYSLLRLGIRSEAW